MLTNMFSRSAAEPDPRAIDHEEFVQTVKDDLCVVVDVREEHEFASAHIPNSLNMPLSTFDPLLLPSGKPVILICHSGRRSLHALGKAHASGRQEVKHYAGGVAGWRSRGGALSR
jgi:rhodanese-related sulfurtransferase